MIKLPNISRLDSRSSRPRSPSSRRRATRCPDYPGRAGERRRAPDQGHLRLRQGLAPSIPSCARATPIDARTEGGQGIRPTESLIEWARGRPTGRRPTCRRCPTATSGTNEQSVTVPARRPRSRIVHTTRRTGSKTTLKEGIELLPGEIIDSTRMSRRALVAFLEEQIAEAKAQGRALLPPHEGDDDEGLRPDHLRPRGPRTFYAPVFEKHGATLEKLGVDPNHGLRRPNRGEDRRRFRTPRSGQAIEADIQACYAANDPAIAMVNSDKGITNLHVPSDVIIDASMPPMIRDSGGMWNADGRAAGLQGRDPGFSSYAGVYQAVVEDCQANGAYDPDHDGHGPERRPDGEEGPGIRLARQDLRDRGRRQGHERHRCRGPRNTLMSHDGRRRATSGAPAR